MLKRNDIISQINEDLGLAKKDIEAVVHKFEEKIKDALSEGEHVLLQGFGKFEIRERSARTGRIPQTGEPIEIPATQAVGFKVGKVLKEAVKSSDTQQ